MARGRDSDGAREPSRQADAALPRRQRGDRRPHRAGQVEQDRATDDARIAADGTSNTVRAEPEGPLPIPVGSKPLNIWMPTNSADLGIYKRMIERGLIRPFELPKEMESLAERIMEMMRVAQESGRLREAMKAAEILRLLAADNRQMAMELDRIDRLDAGKPTQISGQVSAEAQERIKRIVSTQRARVANTEEGHVGDASDRAGDHVRPGMPRGQQASEASYGSDTARRDHAAPQDDRIGGTQGEQEGQAQ